MAYLSLTDPSRYAGHFGTCNCSVTGAHGSRWVVAWHRPSGVVPSFDVCERSYSSSSPVSAGMGDRLRAGILYMADEVMIRVTFRRANTGLAYSDVSNPPDEGNTPTV